MRICGGLYRSIRLDCPARGVRPTTEKVKEAIFSVLGAELVDKTVLDLFAGCGSLGIEALSRGARQAHFVEHSRHGVDVIIKNLTKVGIREKARVTRADVRSFIRTPSLAFDLIFMDPPYNKGLASELTPRVYRLLNTGGILVVEHAPTEPIESAVWKSKRYGDTAVSFLVRGEP
ncbi:MAG TPA: 16S rRNA (guanine(966)-N(2))-methyltransferase RsmD [Deltaproteobacteria bacterium]|nr:16S rRNA (guanine(966)-N(2))-methyltransferase RsmD [Deltaproteobacteria bacterium]